MTVINSPIKLIIGIIFAMPPKLGNLVHEIIRILSVNAHPSFEAFSAFAKIAIIVFGYFLIIMSFLQLQHTPGHRVHRYSRNPKF